MAADARVSALGVLSGQLWALCEVCLGPRWVSLSLIMRAVFVCSCRPGVVTPRGGAASSLVVFAVKSDVGGGNSQLICYVTAELRLRP